MILDGVGSLWQSKDASSKNRRLQPQRNEPAHAQCAVDKPNQGGLALSTDLDLLLAAAVRPNELKLRARRLLESEQGSALARLDLRRAADVPPARAGLQKNKRKQHHYFM